MFLRISKKAELAVVPEVLTRCEHNPAGLSLARHRTQQVYRLKLQCEYFDPSEASSYAGILRSIAALLTPQPIVAAWKRQTRRG